MMIVANGSMQVIEGKVELPLTIEEVTRLCEVKFAEHLVTVVILGLDAQAELYMYFGSRLKKVFMPDKSGSRTLLSAERNYSVTERLRLSCGEFASFRSNLRASPSRL